MASQDENDRGTVRDATIPQKSRRRSALGCGTVLLPEERPGAGSAPMRTTMKFRFFCAVLAITTVLTASLLTGGCTGTSSGGSSGSSAPAAGTGPGSHPNKNTDTGAGPGIR